MEEQKSILQLLREDLKFAQETLGIASKNFDRIMTETPSGLPRADGVQRIRNVSRELSLARQALVSSIDRLNDFMTRGIVRKEFEEPKIQGEKHSSSPN